MTSPDLTQVNIETIAAMFPNAVTERLDEDGNVHKSVDFDLLRQELSDNIVEGPQERYRLDWPGKRAAAFTANAPISRTFRPNREESREFDETNNLFIEGDNLEALKMLQAAYVGQIKLVYIDPPYNTGHDFVYKDHFATTSTEYLQLSGQTSESGERLLANTDSNGRFHSDWLSMMYPRLRLARNLLREDGVIAISIDENELANLTVIADEVFGRSNYLTTLVWRTRTGSNDPGVSVSTDHEYILVYGRSPKAALRGVAKVFDSYSNPDNDPRGPWMSGDLTCNKSTAERPNLGYKIVDPATGNTYEPNPSRAWAYEPKRMSELIEDKRIIFPKDTSRRPSLKRFQTDLRSDRQPLSSLLDVSLGMMATKELKALFDGENLFSHPKGLDLLKLLVDQTTSSDDIILDFFAGSGTTGHAVWSQNLDDGGRRRFILIQIAEELPSTSRARHLGYKHVAELSRLRLSKAAESLSSRAHPASEIDLGYRTLVIDSSNMVDVSLRADETDQLSLSGLTETVRAGRSGEDLLFQVMMDWGLELTLPVHIEHIDDHEVFVVEDGALIACFDPELAGETLRRIAGLMPLRAVFMDSGFASDSARINAEQIFREVSPATDVRVI